MAVASAIAALTLAPRAFEAGFLLSAQDDPVALADHAVARSFDATVAAREIDAALAANDADLAQSFLDLARDRNVPVDPALAAEGRRGQCRRGDRRALGRELRPRPHHRRARRPVGLAGTAVGDLFVFGDIRDAVREGTRLAAGQQADELILGLACVGLAVTAGTYATLGAAAPARVGLTVVKAARKTGRLGEPDGGLDRPFGARGGRLDGAAARHRRRQHDRARGRGARRARGGQGREGAATRAARRRCRPRAGKAGTQAALDGLKLAEGPRDMSRIARLAAAKGGKTRAILKLAGRGAIVLTVGAFNLATWMFWALVTRLRLCLLAQAHDRTHHRALLRPPQAAPARHARARAGGTARARTRSERTAGGRTDRHRFSRAGLGA